VKKILWIIIVALAVRLLFVGFWYLNGQGARVASDAEIYREIAGNIEEGKGFRMNGEPTARRPPLYPLWVAFFIKGGCYPLGVRLGDAVLGALSCFFVFGIGRELFGRRAGGLAAVFFAVDYISVRQIVSLLSETLFVFLLFASFYLLVLGQKRHRRSLFFWSGVLGGLTLLTRDVLLLYYPFLILWLLFETGAPCRQSLMRAGFLMLGLIIAAGPWVLRNSLVFHKPTLITLSAGLTFYVANNPTSSGGSTGGDWEIGKDTVLPTTVRSKLWTSGAEKEFFRMGIDFIKGSPRRFFELMGKKIVNTWRPYQTDSPRAIRWVTGFPYILIMILSLIGIGLNLRRWREFMPFFILIGYVFLLHAVLIGEIRYRYPVMPFFMIFAAAGALGLWSKIRRQRGVEA
jgi:4-amino-4-deoxy-L-arabinose transferase-like glycosyltransferase